MDGITYLATETIYHTEMQPGFSINTIICFFIGFILWFLISRFIINKISGFWTVFSAIIIFSLSIYFGIMNANKITVEDYTTYDVIIDDSVGFNDFNKAYNVIKVKGEIYTIVEKEPGSINAYLSENN